MYNCTCAYAQTHVRTRTQTENDAIIYMLCDKVIYNILCNDETISLRNTQQQTEI